MTTQPRGPYADGVVSESRLHVPECDLRRFGLPELFRMVHIWWTFSSILVTELTRRLLRIERGRSWGQTVAHAIRLSFVALGPTFVKLGQLVASSPGLFPRVLADELKSLFDDVPSFDFDLVRETIEDDLGHPIEDMFVSIDAMPLASASISQVHACTLHDGRDAVIKVQRPSLIRDIDRDLRIQYRLARLIDRTKRGRLMNPVGVVHDFNRTVHEELNFLLEATRQASFREHIGYFGDNKWITAPEVYWDACGPRTLCMERMYGVPFDTFHAFEERAVDAELLLRRGVKVWFEAAYVHGLFHGDVHAGNIWLLDDGRGAYLDFGLMGSLAPEYRQANLAALETSMIDGDYRRVVTAFQRVGLLPEGLGDVEQVAEMVKSMVEPMLDNRISDVNLGEILENQLALAEQFGTRADENMVLVTKQLMYFERYVKALAPDWQMARDLFLVKNIFPEQVARKAADDGICLPED